MTCSRLLPNIAPFEAYTGQKLSLAYMHIPKDLCKKLSPKSCEGIFFGYANTTKGYKIWDIEKQ
jgi:uncharacterized protein (DUF2249 family)